MIKKLNERHKMFVQKILTEPRTPIDIYIDVYPTSNRESAAVNVSKFLREGHPVRDAIEQQRAKITAALMPKMVANQRRILEELTSLGLANIKHLFDEDGRPLPLHQLPDELTAAIVEIKDRVVKRDGEETIIDRTYKLANKVPSLELLGKHLRMWTEKIETEHSLSASSAKIMQLIGEGNPDDSALPGGSDD